MNLRSTFINRDKVNLINASSNAFDIRFMVIHIVY